ncbi:MAG: hypothetical protein SFX73_34390 [Kofleriaceae bacterium]|nr:hypothetical protein [Kofleriaceae bacterium]
MREAAREAKEDLKQQQREVAERAVWRYELQLRVLSTVHHECGPRIDWDEIANARPPAEPKPVNTRTLAVQAEIDGYRPGLFAKLFGGEKKNRSRLAQALEDAKREDADETKGAREAYTEACQDAEDAKVLARAVLRGDVSRYLDALSGVSSFEELEGVAQAVTAAPLRPDLVLVEIVLPSSDVVVPAEQFSLTKAGKLSTKAMPKTRANEIYQDYACGAALRACREVFAALPVEWTFAIVRTNLLNATTGHTELAPVLSLVAPRRTVERLNFEALDPSDAMSNFTHRMGFKKSAGMTAIEAHTIGDMPEQAGAD